MTQNPHTFVMDYIVSPAIIVGSVVLTILPTIALLLPIIWYGIQIYESATFKRWLAAWSWWNKPLGWICTKLRSILGL